MISFLIFLLSSHPLMRKRNLLMMTRESPSGALSNISELNPFHQSPSSTPKSHNDGSIWIIPAMVSTRKLGISSFRLFSICTFNHVFLRICKFMARFLSLPRLASARNGSPCAVGSRRKSQPGDNLKSHYAMKGF